MNAGVRMRAVLWVLVLWGLCLGCDPTTGNNGYKFTCTEARNDWKLCNQNRVRYCHIDHFHTGQNCEQQGLKCKETGESQAVCVDESKSCTGGESKCDGNTATNCVGGHFSVEPCGTAKTCETKDGKAYCKPKVESCGGNGQEHDGKCECNKGYKVDPNDDKNCIKE